MTTKVVDRRIGSVALVTRELLDFFFLLSITTFSSLSFSGFPWQLGVIGFVVFIIFGTFLLIGDAAATTAATYGDVAVTDGDNAAVGDAVAIIAVITRLVLQKS